MLQAITAACALLLGLCFGSFANVLIWRLPRGESIVRPPSHCLSCGHRLSALDMVPVFSWVFLRGRCRWCKERIPPRYPVVEAGCAALFVCMAAYTGPDLSVVPLCALAFVLLCVSYIDADTQEIPDGLLIFGAMTGVAWTAASSLAPSAAPGWRDALLGAAAGALPLLFIDRISLLLLKKDGFGYGDAKLMAMAGLFLGWRLSLLSLFFAFMAGGAFCAAMLCTKRLKRGAYMAFGPFLSIGVLAALWFGEPFMALLFPG